jgi:hypothetical protein
VFQHTHSDTTAASGSSQLDFLATSGFLLNQLRGHMNDFDGVEFCAYCFEERADKISCCQENHFIEFKDLDEETQKELKELK